MWPALSVTLSLFLQHYQAMDLISNTLGLPLASIPQLLWKYYLEYLWYYEPDSWVARTAHGARLLAVLVALPIVILALLARNMPDHLLQFW